MSLQLLPLEILLQIFLLLGSAFFRQDARRLLVSKWWYQLAWPVLLQDLKFSDDSLLKFVLASNKVDFVRSIQHHVRTVSLSLDGFEDWHSAQSGLGSMEIFGIEFYAVNTWITQLNGRLTALASILQQCTRLQSLRLEARPERHNPELGIQRRNYLKTLSLIRLVSISHLTCLEIDTAGTCLTGPINTSRRHPCDTISTMLSTLRRLRCRMSSICPRIFNAHAPGKGPFLSLEDVVINLSLSETSDSDTSYRYSSRCRCVPTDSFNQLKADMESRARELVHIMKNPRIVRIVSHTYPDLEMRSFDALTGRRMVLASAVPWDADGEEVEEGATAQDLFDSDSSSEES
ncbi:hypothetical protein QQS21_005476 [Conoideocrella luteorostrata]|uniref:F-box domain-containing protein n=1 Tax=Conoideocrella luteorostrata TaxID=1105319 RepID=A0AAJ0CPE1_9HYPO|nr:hypothetical protein QQS21_005476 [Conoideocrella luteorostrata]